jgi:arsenate reductase-like glutaredoxin family protein
LRRKEARYKVLKLDEQVLSEDEIVSLMIKFPELIQRPIVERGTKAILARPANRIGKFLAKRPAGLSGPSATQHRVFKTTAPAA